MNILLVGFNGKMGREVLKLKNEKFNIFAGVDLNAEIEIDIKKYKKFKQIDRKMAEKVDIVLDFSLPSVLNEELAFCLKNNKPIVICSTGHSEEQLDLIKRTSKIIPVFKTTNTSIGIALINKIIKDNLNILKQYEINIIEKHHKYKKDAPSGTAKAMMDLFNGISANCYSIRAGNIVGEHELLLTGKYEQLFIKHISNNRALFAEGALNICAFLLGQNKGFYDMGDYLTFIINKDFDLKN